MDKYLEEARRIAGSRKPEALVQKLTAEGYNKSTIARLLFEQGLSVSAVSHIIPMAYSQAHSVFASMPRKSTSTSGATRTTVSSRARTSTAPSRTSSGARAAPAASDPAPGWGLKPEEYAKFRRPQTRPTKSPILNKKPNQRVGKLRTPGLPSDIDVGECANCGFDLVVRNDPTGYMLIHVNTSTEDYLKVTQFCNGVPVRLVR